MAHFYEVLLQHHLGAERHPAQATKTSAASGDPRHPLELAKKLWRAYVRTLAAARASFVFAMIIALAGILPGANALAQVACRPTVFDTRIDHPRGIVYRIHGFYSDEVSEGTRRSFLDALAIGESGGDYYAHNPTSSAHGKYQFLDGTDLEVSRRTGLFGEDPISQDTKAWYLASTTYSKNTGRNLEFDLRSGGHAKEIAVALRKVWPSVCPGGTTIVLTPAQILATGGKLPPTRRY